MPLTAIREQSVSCCLGRAPAEVSHAREQTRKALFGWGLEGHTELAEIIVSELVTNAICHGEGPVRARISHGDNHLHVQVHDDGPGRPVRRQAATEDESGRGLAVIDGLIDMYGGSLSVIDDGAGTGKTVYVAICLAGDR
ncbi:MAG TPA: ATP-binding protein [Trebonia sp.]|jgi:anti-sigma regulatory factor (Ser/Thr protein kinase)|nr:ATP-binding protein [Trebonia sp.]